MYAALKVLPELRQCQLRLGHRRELRIELVPDTDPAQRLSSIHRGSESGEDIEHPVSGPRGVLDNPVSQRIRHFRGMTLDLLRLRVEGQDVRIGAENRRQDLVPLPTSVDALLDDLLQPLERNLLGQLR